MRLGQRRAFSPRAILKKRAGLLGVELREENDADVRGSAFMCGSSAHFLENQPND